MTTNPNPTEVDYSDCDEWELFILFGEAEDDDEM